MKSTISSSHKFDFSSFVPKGLALQSKYTKGDVTITLPDNMSFKFTPTEEDRKIATEIFIFCHDKSVLIERECCNTCVENALSSLQKIRDKFLELKLRIGNIDSPLYQLIDYAALGIVQFVRQTENYDSVKDTWDYRDALDHLRAHLINVLNNINLIAGIKETYVSRFTLESPYRLGYHINLLEKYKGKEASLLKMLKDENDKFIIGGEPEDLMTIFTGNEGTPIKWYNKNYKPGDREIIFFIVLLHLLTIEDPKDYLGLNIPAEGILEILNHFVVPGGKTSKLSSVRSMRSAFKGWILNKENYQDTSDIPQRSSRMIEVVTKTFGLNFSIPLQ